MQITDQGKSSGSPIPGVLPDQVSVHTDRSPRPDVSGRGATQPRLAGTPASGVPTTGAKES